MSTDSNPPAPALLAAKRRYKIPEAARSKPTDPHEVVLREVTFSERELAEKAAESGGKSIAYELLKHSIVSADGQAITWDASGKERFIEGCSQQVLQLLLRAWTRIHLPADEVIADFLATEDVIA